MTFEKIQKLAARFEKIANFPDKESVHKIISDSIENLKSNPLLKGILGISNQTTVSNSIGEPSFVYFQLVTDPKAYSAMIQEPQKSMLCNFLRPIITETLENHFRQYDFKVTIGFAI